MLVMLLPVLALLTAFFFGSLRFSARAQARVALQSRLDVCAVRAAVARERFYARMAAANEGVNDTKLAIYALRAAALVPGAGEAALATQEELVQINHALAEAEDAYLAGAAAAELVKLRCAPTTYSREAATCLATPPLATALERETTLFPDVTGTLTHRRDGPGEPLARIRCFGPNESTTIEVTGDAAIRRLKGYEDAYAKTP